MLPDSKGNIKQPWPLTGGAPEVHSDAREYGASYMRCRKTYTHKAS